MISAKSNSGLCASLYHEVRKHEKKLRNMSKEAHKQAEKAREAFLQNARDPHQQLVIIGSSSDIKHDNNLYNLIHNQDKLIKRQIEGTEEEIFVDKFDGINLLEKVPRESEDVDGGEALDDENMTMDIMLNYERYRNLIEAQRVGIPETKILEMSSTYISTNLVDHSKFGTNNEKSKKDKEKNKQKEGDSEKKYVNVGFNYEDEQTKEGLTSFTTLNEKAPQEKEKKFKTIEEFFNSFEKSLLSDLKIEEYAKEYKVISYKLLKFLEHEQQKYESNKTHRRELNDDEGKAEKKRKRKRRKKKRMKKFEERMKLVQENPLLAKTEGDDSEDNSSESSSDDEEANDTAANGEKVFITDFDFEPNKVERKHSDDEIDNDEDAANEEIFTKFFSHLLENSDNVPYILEKFKQNIKKAKEVSAKPFISEKTNIFARRALEQEGRKAERTEEQNEKTKQIIEQLKNKTMQLAEKLNEKEQKQGPVFKKLAPKKTTRLSLSASSKSSSSSSSSSSRSRSRGKKKSQSKDRRKRSRDRDKRRSRSRRRRSRSRSRSRNRKRSRGKKGGRSRDRRKGGRTKSRSKSKKRGSREKEKQPEKKEEPKRGEEDAKKKKEKPSRSRSRNRKR